MSVYIHIPFCSNICSYCDFCKLLKNDKWIGNYLDFLEKEVKLNYKGEIINTIYIGGGSPSCLSILELKKLFDIIGLFNVSDDAEITIEVNSDDLDDEKILFLKDKVNRISVGIQTFDKNRLFELNRSIDIDNVHKVFNNFDNVNVDLMYGFHNQSMDDLKDDLDKLIKLNPKHISTYCLILEENTKLYIDGYKSLVDDKEREMYDYICKTLKDNGYVHYELSNFCKSGFSSKHNLVYWNNECYYGFGLGASGFIDGIRYSNTRNLSRYLKGDYLLESHKLTFNETIENEFILGLRKINGINKEKFYLKYGFDIKDIDIVRKLLDKGLLLEDDNIYINPKYLYTSNEILINFIDLSLHEH